MLELKNLNEKDAFGNLNEDTIYTLNFDRMYLKVAQIYLDFNVSIETWDDKNDIEINNYLLGDCENVIAPNDLLEDLKNDLGYILEELNEKLGGDFEIIDNVDKKLNFDTNYTLYCMCVDTSNKINRINEKIEELEG